MENGNRKNSPQKLLFLGQCITSVLKRVLENLKRMVQSNALFYLYNCTKIAYQKAKMLL